MDNFLPSLGHEVSGSIKGLLHAFEKDTSHIWIRARLLVNLDFLPERCSFINGSSKIVGRQIHKIIILLIESKERWILLLSE